MPKRKAKGQFHISGRKRPRKGKGILADLGKKALFTLTPIVVKAIANKIISVVRSRSKKRSGKGLVMRERPAKRPRRGLRNLGSGVHIPRAGTGLRRAGEGRRLKHFLIQPQGQRLMRGQGLVRAGGRGIPRLRRRTNRLKGLSAKQKKILQAIQ